MNDNTKKDDCQCAACTVRRALFGESEPTERQPMPEGQFDLQFWAESSAKAFDHTAAYQERIMPLMQQIQAICNELNIPVAIRMCVSSDDKAQTMMAGCQFLTSGEYIGRNTAEVLMMAQPELGCSPDAISNIIDLMNMDRQRTDRIMGAPSEKYTDVIKGSSFETPPPGATKH